MRRILIPLITLFWITIIWILSSQNGTETAETGSKFIEFIASLIYKNPSNSQISQLTFIIRQMARIVLFSGFGILFYLSIKLSFTKKNSEKAILILSILLVGLISFADEWRKQFIIGRHFELNQGLLNVICSIIGVLFAYFIWRFITKRKDLT